MTQEKIIRMMKEAGFYFGKDDEFTPEWERFASLVRAEALEEAAKWCEAKQSYNAMHANTELAAAIRGLK